ncbi:hypothetical protein BDN67DRAFT_991809 [Paxillus ammoniavirescens]|nr:hypothetical protein BDN67DRAFT_991809 [Paxillus ammoniavirescens]
MDYPHKDIPWPEIMEVHDNTQSFQCIKCPNTWCLQEFQSTQEITEHLNAALTEDSCWSQEQFHLRLPPALWQGSTAGKQRTGQYHPLSGETYGKSKNLLQQFKDDQYHTYRLFNPFYPFAGAAEWTLGKFLAENLTQAQINRFLKLKWFEEHTKPTFMTADQLLGWIDNLPTTSTWQSVQFEIKGYPTASPIQLIWRDGLETARGIISNPIFTNNISFDPIKVQENHDREYGEWFTGTDAFDIQDKLPTGATIVPIIAASDKTPVTRHTGGLEMHPLFITIGNIDSDIRMKATAHAWQCVAFIPTPKFETHPDYQTILQTRLWHKCVDLVFANLKSASLHSDYMTDPFGDIQHCFTPLVAWTADLPEQLMIACVSKNASPVTEASLKQFGDGQRHAPRTGEMTLERIFDITQVVDPWNLDRFQKHAKAMLLTGVHLPFWRDWAHSTPSIFLVPEVLHTLHKLFFDHILVWCKEIMGKAELDLHFKAAHKRISLEHHDIQRKIVPILAGVTPPNFIAAICCIIDFIYQAQSPVHTDTTIESMQASLNKFHHFKDAIIEAGARKGKSGVKTDFYIPKLELLQSFADAIKSSGVIIQYTADVSERLLITHCKKPFLRTSKQAKDFVEQVIQILDCEEKMRLFDLFTLLSNHGQSLINSVVTKENDELTSSDPALAWISRVVPTEEKQYEAPRPAQNHFVKGILSTDTSTALHVTITPDCKRISLEELSQLTKLPDITQAVINYISLQTPKVSACFSHFTSLDTWFKFRVQLRSTFRPSTILPSQLMQAYPPDGLFPLGNCDVVLLDSSDSQNLCQTPDQDPSTRMWMVKRCVIETDQGFARLGEVIPLTRVSQAAELVLVYGQQADRVVTSHTSQELYHHFYLNHYADKEVYNSLHGSLDVEYYYTPDVQIQ